MFVDNKNLDVKDKVNDEKVAMLNKNALSDKEYGRSQNAMVQRTSDKRIDTVDADELGHLCHQFRILCSNFVFIFVTLAL